MAGYAYGFDEGGAIPDDDNSGAAPVAAQPDDNSGALPVVSPDQTAETPDDEQPSRSGVDFNVRHVPANAKRIIQYLMGGDAAPPEVADKFAQGVKHENPGINDDDANVIAVHKAGEMGGPAAAFAMLQFNRQSYNAKQSFAKAALNGVDGKAGDAQAAAQAASQAATHILDGSSTIFTANQGGFTATVKLPGTDRRLNFNLTPEQFNQWLDVGGHGQWDKVMEEGGTPAALQRLATPRAGIDYGRGQAPSQQREDRGTKMPTEDELGYDPQIMARATRMFGPGGSQQKYEWMNAQQAINDQLSNKVDVAKETGENRIKAAQAAAGGRVGAAEAHASGQRDAAHERAGGQRDAAQIRAEGYAKAQQQKAQLALQKMAQQAKDANERNRVNVATRLINNPNWATQSKEERNAILKQYGLESLMEGNAPSSPAAPASPPAAAPSPQQGANQQDNAVPPANQRVTGQVYRTPKGQFRWMGNGWQPVQ